MNPDAGLVTEQVAHQFALRMGKAGWYVSVTGLKGKKRPHANSVEVEEKLEPDVRQLLVLRRVFLGRGCM